MKSPSPFSTLNGALLINKHAGVSSFGIIEELQRELLRVYSAPEGENTPPEKRLRKRDLPKMGHGGTLDPFATGVLIVCVGRAVKLARYFLGSSKIYEGVIRFGETTIPGDPTAEISEKSDCIPTKREEIQAVAHKMTLQPYYQTPPMHSAKKKGGKTLYELARQGIEVEREPRLCHLHSFEILDYQSPCARFRVECSSGTYIRTLSQDLGKLMGSVAMLDSLHRSGSGSFKENAACTVRQISEAMSAGKTWDELPCWVPFDRLLDGYDRAEATPQEAEALMQGRQNVLFDILKRIQPSPSPGHKLTSEDSDEKKVVIACQGSLVAVACRIQGVWGLERVFTTTDEPGH